MNKIIHFFKDTGQLLKETFQEFGKRDPFRGSAIIAYFAIFSLPGLLVIVMNVAGYFMEKDVLQQTVSGQVTDLIGTGPAEDINKILSRAQDSGSSGLANIVSIATLVFGATGIFFHVQKTLNLMWGVQADPERKILKLLKDRLFSFGMIMVAGFLLIVSLLMSSLLATFSDWITRQLFEEADVIIQALEFILSLIVISLMFAAMFKFLPDATIQWRDVGVGAVVTTVLFLIAKYALSYYFAKADPGSVYGAAGSLVLIMLWVTYTGLILLFGAAFTKVYADRYGSAIRPAEHASWRRRRQREKDEEDLG